MAYKLRCRRDKRFCGHLFNFNRVVGNKSVTAFYKLDCGFALAYPAVAEYEYSLTVCLDKHAVARHSFGKADIERRDQASHEIRGCILCTQQRRFIFLCAHQNLVENIKSGSYHNRNRFF